MDFGLAGRNAIICASSRGLGRACAVALAREGVNVTLNGRDKENLAKLSEKISADAGVSVQVVAGDVGSASVRAALVDACPKPDILINNNSGPPVKNFLDIGEADFLSGINANMYTPLALVQAVIPGMRERKFGRILNITSSSVKMPLQGLELSSGARAGLISFLAGVARQVACDNVTINNILPGAFDTDRLRTAAQAQADMRGVAVEVLSEERRRAIPAQRFGDPEEFGALCAFLASQQAGYITGQNFLIDGGSFASAF